MNNPIDVFFSYHTDSCADLVQELATTLESPDINIGCWYAKRDIKATQNYTAVIPQAIKECKLFVLLLNKFSMNSNQVMREANIASTKTPIMIIRLDDCSLEDNSIVYISSAASQVATINESNRSILVQKICDNIIEWFKENDKRFAEYKGSEDTKYKPSWDTNELKFFGDEGERVRIDVQHQFVYKFAKDEYDKLLPDLSSSSFLDIGCNTGVQSKMFLWDKTVKHYIGIDREQEALEQAKLTFPDGHMYLCDCEAEDFSDKLYEIEEELNISGFDVINVSMLLLHTKNPAILIDVLSSHLSENGKLIILDIDDGFNIAYPDPQGMFDKAIQLCFKTEYSGFRHSGRAINKFLSDTELNNIKLHKIGLSSIGMSRKEKDEFFDIYFWFVLDDLQKMSEENPNDKILALDYKWMKNNYAKMKNQFKSRGFFFNLGFVLYSAHI